MHIGFLSTEYPPLRSGGIGTSVRNLARALVGLGHRVTVVGWREEATRFNDQGVDVRFAGHTNLPKMGWLLHRRQAQATINQLVRDEQLDIIEAPDWLGLSAGMRLNCPLVIRCHGSATYFGQLLNEPVRRGVHLAEKLALRRANSVAAVSQFTAGRTAQLFGLKQSVHAIPNGVNLAQFRPADSAEIEPDTLLYFGTLVRKKGILDLCHIFSELVARRPSARLRIVGRDIPDKLSGSSSTWALCQGLLSAEARARTDYLGVKPYEEMQAYVRTASVCVFPSYAEALPVSWIEAMASGVPIVAYDIGWAPELVQHGETGSLVPLGDQAAFAQAIETILQHSQLVQQYGSNALQYATKNFDNQVVAAQTVAWYQQVIGTNGN